MKTMLIVFGIITMLLGGFFYKIGAPATKTVTEIAQRDATLATVNGGDAELIKQNVLNANAEEIRRIPAAASYLIILLGAGVMFWGISKKGKVNGAPIAATALVLFCLINAGCRRPINVPEYEEIGTSETAYVVPLEGDIGKQIKFDSAEQYDNLKVATKRILIEKRWEPQGRDYQTWVGIWKPIIKVIKVDRAPVTVEWEAQPGKSGIDDAIWAESADSIGFSMGWTVTAYITEADASKFLYMYPAGSLKNVMDNEVRAQIQSAVADIANKYKLDELRDKKGEITDEVRKLIIPFFEKRGITITTIGQFAGMTYENNKIQGAIDETFIAQQEKVKAKAALDAQADKNTVIEQAAKAEAEAARTRSQGLADGNLMVAKAEADGIAAKAKAEAEGIEAINKAIEKSGEMLIQLKQMEVDKIKYQKWSGEYPDTVIGAGSNLWIGLDDSKKKAAVTNP